MVATMAMDREPDTAPQYVHALLTGAEPVDDLILDTATLRDLSQQVQEIEEARAAAAVSGRDYLVR